MLKPTYSLPDLPPPVELETPRVLKALARASRALAELKGRAAIIPNPGILIDTLSLQEAKASSEIENIVTTHDDLFQAEALFTSKISPAIKEVASYRTALKAGFEALLERGGFISSNMLLEVFQVLLERSDEFRKIPGTALQNQLTRDIVYVPPQDHAQIIAEMSKLEQFINRDGDGLDPILRMAIIHHQFESIHPFVDGNGRVGRILNVLYLTKEKLLEIPILYMSSGILKTKDTYYDLLQAVRDTNGSAEAWENWVLYMVTLVEDTALSTLSLVHSIRAQMQAMKHKLRSDLPKLYSQELLNNLFRHPYTRVEFIMADLGVTRQTAARRLDQLAERGFVTKHQLGRNNYYINHELVDLFYEN